MLVVMVPFMCMSNCLCVPDAVDQAGFNPVPVKNVPVEATDSR